MIVRIFLFALLFGIDFYAFQAVRLALESQPPVLKTVAFALFWGITAVTVGFVLSYGYFLRNQTTSKSAIRLLRGILMIAWLSKFIIVVFLFLDDGRRLALSLWGALSSDPDGFPERSRTMASVAVTMGFVPFVTLVYGILRNRHRYTVFREKITLKNLPPALNGLKIVQISDIHSGSFTDGEPLRKGIQLINRENPDLVFFTGDLVNSVADEIVPYLDIFGQIRARYGVFSVFGNHDYGDYVRWPSAEMKRENLRRLAEYHRQMGWQLLRNENRIVDIRGEKVAVIGVENYSASPRFQKYGDLAKAAAGTASAALRLLLSHDPSHWEAEVVPCFKNIAVTFSGHTHGMQFGIEIPGWFRWSPAKWMYKQWAGLYQSGQQFLYVNRGFGYLGYHGRVGILPEITVIELYSDLSD
ncbi:MAG: metallophosphoesterase [Bacteroidetes bacterium]|nr:MAG: metallophosphoesterase [Bacteroidota bacterium]